MNLSPLSIAVQGLLLMSPAGIAVQGLAPSTDAPVINTVSEDFYGSSHIQRQNRALITVLMNFAASGALE